MRLFTYIVSHDTGFAPNPFWGVCTLVTCKPKIRCAANEKDWIAGISSKASGNKLIYAMQVTKKMPLKEYDKFVNNSLVEKKPDWFNRDPRRRLGDAIYDFSKPSISQHLGMHGPGNMEHDLSGKNALLSNHFLYFGDKAENIPPYLRNIIPQRGHRSNSNSPYVQPFIDWISQLGHLWNSVLGNPTQWPSNEVLNEDSEQLDSVDKKRRCFFCN